MLPVLMYHGLHADAQARGRFDPKYSVCPQAFARQLDWLLEHGYRSVRLDDRVASGLRRLVVSFDDGDISNVEVAVPLLRERNMVAEFFITTDFIGQPGMLSAADVRYLIDAGMGVGSHGRSHAFLEDLDASSLETELLDSRRRLHELCGREVNSLALPGGRGGIRELRCAQHYGYRHLLGSVPGPNRQPRPGTWLQRLAVTRTTTLSQFVALVRWRGLHPQLARAQFMGLTLPKRVLGNAGYQRLRARLMQ